MAPGDQPPPLGFPPNQRYTRTFRVVCGVPGTPVQFPTCIIPDGMALVIKGYPTNTNFVYVGASSNSARNRNSSYPLSPNEVLRYFITEAHELYLDAAIANESVICTVEQATREG